MLAFITHQLSGVKVAEIDQKIASIFLTWRHTQISKPQTILLKTASNFCETSTIGVHFLLRHLQTYVHVTVTEQWDFSLSSLTRYI